MQNNTIPSLLVLILITPAFFIGLELQPSLESLAMANQIADGILDKARIRHSFPEEDMELNMMFFTETVSSQNGKYYVCRRGMDDVTYFGQSFVKYLSGGTVFTLEFPGSRAVIPEGVSPTGSTTNYFYGNNPRQWKTGRQRLVNFEI
jgi:hypothetical protein